MRFFVGVMALVMSLAACADASKPSEKYQEGVHYQVLADKVRTLDPNKIEVTEVFWYGCSHCYHFEPLVVKWKQDLADDVVFQQSPAMWNGLMETHARAFYVARSLGVLDKVHQPLFDKLYSNNKGLASEGALAAFFAKHGVDEKQFKKAYNSFGVNSQVKQADSRARSYRIQGTPEVVVNGTYRVSSRMTGSQQGMLDVADYLIEKIRAEK